MGPVESTGLDAEASTGLGPAPFAEEHGVLLAAVAEALDAPLGRTTLLGGDETSLALSDRDDARRLHSAPRALCM